MINTYPPSQQSPVAKKISSNCDNIVSHIYYSYFTVTLTLTVPQLLLLFKYLCFVISVTININYDL